MYVGQPPVVRGTILRWQPAVVRPLQVAASTVATSESTTLVT
jgi:hypothetical protein